MRSDRMTKSVERKSIDEMNERVRQQQAQEEEQKRLMKEAKKAARSLRRSERKTAKAKALNAARQTGYSGTIIMLNGKPVEVVYQSRPAQVVESRNMAPPSYNSKPSYTKETINGIPILKIYRGYSGELYAVAWMGSGSSGLIWGRRYNPETGMWQGGDYNLTSKQIDELSFGMEVVVNNGSYGTSVSRSSSIKKGNSKARKRTSPPKNPTKKKPTHTKEVSRSRKPAPNRKPTQSKNVGSKSTKSKGARR